MATVLSQYSATGFHRATVSKALLGGIFLSSTAVNVPWSSHLQKYLFCDSSDVILRGQVWKLLVSRLAFPNAKEIFCVAILIYYFRIFERRFGSQKFASFLLITSTISTIMELFTVHAVKTVLPDLSDKIGSLPPGPYSLVFPLFVYFWYDVPKGAGTHLVGIPITAKTFTYLLGFQVVGTSVNSAIGAFCGIMAGLLYKFDVLGLKSKFKIPKSLGDLFSATVAKLIESSPPSASSIPVGATLEIQRQQMMDQLEQQMILSRQQELANRGFDNFNRGAPPPEQVVADETLVASLVDMGFSRERAVRALQRANNDIEMATNFMLQDADANSNRQ